jgi:hypothetical protein
LKRDKASTNRITCKPTQTGHPTEFAPSPLY